MPTTTALFIAVAVGVIFIIFIFAKCVKSVPQNEVFIIERLGKYNNTLISGFHVLMPFLDKVAYRHTLKEQVIDVPSQICITRDNISVEVDGVLHVTVVDPKKASYEIARYNFAVIQLAQTTMRSVIGKLELDRTFEERESINADVINAVGRAAGVWGIKINNYEVRNITPPQSLKDANEMKLS